MFCWTALRNVAQRAHAQMRTPIVTARLMISTTKCCASQPVLADAQLLGMILRASQWTVNATGALEKTYTFKNERNADTFLNRRAYKLYTLDNTRLGVVAGGGESFGGLWCDSFLT